MRAHLAARVRAAGAPAPLEPPRRVCRCARAASSLTARAAGAPLACARGCRLASAVRPRCFIQVLLDAETAASRSARRRSCSARSVMSAARRTCSACDWFGARRTCSPRAPAARAIGSGALAHFADARVARAHVQHTPEAGASARTYCCCWVLAARVVCTTSRAPTLRAVERMLLSVFRLSTVVP